MPKFAKEDPFESYRDGNCRDISGQIVPCGAESAVSPPKWPEGDEPPAQERPDADTD